MAFIKTFKIKIMAAIATKSKEEIQGLKDAWRNDPIWDIEESEGFEAHKKELLEYRKKWEGIWEEKRFKFLKAKGEKMGVTENLELVAYIDFLERRISDLESKINS